VDLEHLQQNWNALGEEDPLWAILSAPDKRGGAWEIDEFLATGRQEVANLLIDLRQRGFEVRRRRRALDFGCGVGRLTQALAEQFTRCDGVDVAASMIAQAARLNRRPDNCHFHHNPASHLALLESGSFDFVLSLLVLQHMEPALMRGYLHEFVRVLRRGGIAYFNVPSGYVLGSELPDEAAQARIEARSSFGEVRAGEPANLEVVIQNVSGHEWPASARLLLGNHWMDADGGVLVHDDGRAAIDRAVPAGGSVTLGLQVVGPSAPGRYVLELDLLQEQIGWFANRGSQTLRVAVPVLRGLRPKEPQTEREAPLSPRIEMHVMAREEVIEVIDDAGGVVLDVIEHERSGPLVPSLDYVVGVAARGGVRSGRRGLTDRLSGARRGRDR
jgi:SAM-dependent methyltransferase